MKPVNLTLRIIIAASIVFCYAGQSFSESTGVGKIRESSLRKSERIYNKIAIDLLNGKSHQVSIDKMASLIDEYDVVEFTSEDIYPAKDLIIREIAFRMLKNRYLPRIGDKIHIYKNSNEFDREAGLYRREDKALQAKIRLSVGAATIREGRQMETLCWADMAGQISSAIRILWVNRISNSNIEGTKIDNELNILKVLDTLNSRYLNERFPKTVDSAANKLSSANELLRAVEDILMRWRAEGLISNKDIPSSVLLLNQYIILNSSVDPSILIRQIRGFRDIGSLYSALVQRIYAVTKNIKANNPYDYAVFAMLQGLLDHISEQVLSLQKNSAIDSCRQTSRLSKPRCSA